MQTKNFNIKNLTFGLLSLIIFIACKKEEPAESTVVQQNPSVSSGPTYIAGYFNITSIYQPWDGNKYAVNAYFYGCSNLNACHRVGPVTSVNGITLTLNGYDNSLPYTNGIPANPPLWVISDKTGGNNPTYDFQGFNMRADSFPTILHVSYPDSIYNNTRYMFQNPVQSNVDSIYLEIRTTGITITVKGGCDPDSCGFGAGTIGNYLSTITPGTLMRMSLKAVNYKDTIVGGKKFRFTTSQEYINNCYKGN
jgi:hypothetical protein